MKIHLSIEADSVQEYRDALASLLFTPPAQSQTVTIKLDETDLALSKIDAETPAHGSAPNEKLIDGFLNSGEALEPTSETEKVTFPVVPAKEKPVKPIKPAKEKPTTAPAVEPVKKAAVIDIDSLRELAYPLNTGGDETKAALKELLAHYSAKSLGEVSVDDYPSLQAAMLKLHTKFIIPF